MAEHNSWSREKKMWRRRRQRRRCAVCSIEKMLFTRSEQINSNRLIYNLISICMKMSHSECDVSVPLLPLLPLLPWCIGFLRFPLFSVETILFYCLYYISIYQLARMPGMWMEYGKPMTADQRSRDNVWWISCQNTSGRWITQFKWLIKMSRNMQKFAGIVYVCVWEREWVLAVVRIKLKGKKLDSISVFTVSHLFHRRFFRFFFFVVADVEWTVAIGIDSVTK